MRPEAHELPVSFFAPKIKERRSVMIELRGLSKVYSNSGKPVKALEDINLTIADGEIFGIIGLSGAGKSTLVRCINLLEKPTSGQVLIDGRGPDRPFPARSCC
jgi:ABC-type oligopeptide transport system ATPase subunit